MASTISPGVSSVLASLSPVQENSHTIYKGKITHRSWAQLPAEIIRLVTTHYILDVCSLAYVPRTWEAREMWHPRLVFTILRDAIEIERLMCITPSWGVALEKHLFWHQACSVIDPQGKLANLGVHQAQLSAGSAATMTVRVTPYRHFRNMTNCSCCVCRINDPGRVTGLGTAKRPTGNMYLQNILVCKDHRKESFCGVCLREAPPMEHESDFNAVCCVENDDVDTWPGIFTTCRTCREEWLWRRVSSNPMEREALGGAQWNSADWETRQTIESFIDLGEGAIQDVINVAMDKHWLRRNTKLGDMLEQAMASARYQNREETGYLSEDELSDADEEDDPELLSMTEDSGGVRDLALCDWARNRILDGFWTSPADHWYHNSVPGLPLAVKAVHPTPWNPDATYEGAMLDGENGNLAEHPRPKTVNAPVPPSFQLCEQAFVAYQKQIRLILLPAMNNIVRRLVIECAADGVDPAMRATKMSLEDVVKELADEASWYNGIDWLERRANGARDRDRERATTEDDRSSLSSKSSGSHETSPVLSTTTLQTTPSPPASADGRDSKKEADSPTGSRATSNVIIPISPVLESPVLLHPVPYIPVTTTHMPQYSQDAFKTVWREACVRLYHCRCSICERAACTANAAVGSVVPSQVVPSNETQQEHVPPRAVVLAIPEEEEESTDDELRGTLQDDETVEEEDDQETESPLITSRKRSHGVDAGESEDDDGRYPLNRRRSGSLTKRLRREEDYVLDSPIELPTRLRKRTSEELDEEEDSEPQCDADGREVSTKKRLRLPGRGSSPPVSLVGTRESLSRTPEEDEVILSKARGQPGYASYPRGLRSAAPVRMSEADMAALYTIGPPGEVDV